MNRSTEPDQAGEGRPPLDPGAGQGAGILGHVRRLMIGNGLAQSLQFLSILLLSRIYQPADFGLLGMVQSIATVAAIVATLQMHLVIPLSTGQEQAGEVARTTQTLCLLLAAVSLPVAAWLGFVPVVAVLMGTLVGLSNTYVCVLVFRGQFRQLSAFYVARAVLVVILQVAFALLAVPDGLLWAAIGGEGLAALCLRRLLLSRETRGWAGLATIGRLVRAWKSFSLYGTVQELASVAAFYSPLLWYASRISEAVGGQYAMASRLVWAPVVLISSSISQVLYHRYARLPRDGQPWPGLGWPSPLLLAAAILACLAAFMLQDFFHLMLGPAWGLASKLLPLHLVWGCLFLFSIPFRVACRVLHLQRYQCAVDMVMVAAVAVLFMVPGPSPMGLMWALVALAAVQNGLLCLAAAMQLKRDRRSRA